MFHIIYMILLPTSILHELSSANIIRTGLLTRLPEVPWVGRWRYGLASETMKQEDIISEHRWSLVEENLEHIWVIKQEPFELEDQKKSVKS